MRRNPKIRFYPGVKVYNCSFEGFNALRAGVHLSNSALGEGSYMNKGSEILGASIGRWCSIGDGVRIGFGGHPVRDFVSTSGLLLADTTEMLGFTIHHGKERYPLYRKAEGVYNVVIGHDVWVGAGAKILDGVTIGNGAVIAAGAMVTRDVEPYTIVGGVPARAISKRFTDKQIQFLQAFQWWNKGVDWVKSHYTEMDNIEIFIQKYRSDESLVADME